VAAINYETQRSGAAMGELCGRQVAAVIRNHAEKMLETRSPFFDQTGGVVRAQTHSISLSLVEALTLLVRRDRQSLLVVEPMPPLKSLLRRYGLRVALAALLVFLAFVLPEPIPRVIKDRSHFVSGYGSCCCWVCTNRT
jgi:hypothetical protein